MRISDQYAFLMIDYDTPGIIRKLQSQIKEDELYVQGDDYGIETQSHVTLVAGLDNDVTIDELKPYLDRLNVYRALITNVSKFEDTDFDVLKCDVSAAGLLDTYNRITKNFETHSDHNFHPHMTIAYMKKGAADKYIENTMPNTAIMQPKQFRYSHHDKNGERISVTFTK